MVPIEGDERGAEVREGKLIQTDKCVGPSVNGFGMGTTQGKK